MKYLGREEFERARRFLKTQARPLERALFEVRFEGAPAEAVSAGLAGYQNPDGGFGQALEPDLRTPSSSALATGIGLTALQELGCPADDPMVRRAVAYLLETFDEETDVWRVIPQDANCFPHAGWWHDQDGSLARTFDGYRIIPRAQLVGLLHHYSVLAPAGWLADLTERTVADIETAEPLGTGGGDDLAYALSLADTEMLPEPLKGHLVSRLRSVAPSAVCNDPGAWDTYCITPLKVAPSPRSSVADLIWDAVQAHLDYQIDRQTPEGTWDPVWTWGDFYPEVWPSARREWRGVLTLDTLTALRAFGRLEHLV